MNTSRRTLTALALAAGSLTLVGSGIAQANSSDHSAKLGPQGACTNVGTTNDDNGDPGNDPVVDGTAGADVLCSLAGDDILHGFAGSDMLFAGSDNDVLSGGAGPDVLVPGPGLDTVGGGAGDDFIDAQDGAADTVSCGGGTDTAIVDSTETAITGCETQVTG
jgi:Ca2+-binding RTX toxin-like protein